MLAKEGRKGDAKSAGNHRSQESHRTNSFENKKQNANQMQRNKNVPKNQEGKGSMKDKKFQNQESYESSDEEEISQDLLKSVIKNCDQFIVKETLESLTNAFDFGATCLICISKVKKTEKIWSCTSCYTFFHLACIQRWANDSLAQRRMAQDTEQGYYNNLGEYIPKQNKPIIWNCPKCRSDYQPDEIPRHYQCFCKKQFDPIYQDWLLPHSCGELCMNRANCGHSCLLLCHPGACPPCPQMLTISCECRKSPVSYLI